MFGTVLRKLPFVMYFRMLNSRVNIMAWAPLCACLRLQTIQI